MRLRYLEVENFLSHERETLLFPEAGTFLLSGESGFGKSSLIIDAVGYVLFGATATRATKQDELPNAEFPGQAMQVRALFEFEDDTQLMLARGLDERGASWAQAYEPVTDADESILLAEGPHPVAQLVRRRLGGMTWVQFYAAFVARQTQITQLTSLRGAERKTLVHDMLGMREIKRATEQTARRLRTGRVQLESVSGAIGERTLASEQIALDQAQAEAQTTETRYQQGRTQLASMQQRVQTLSDELAPMRAIEAAQTRLRQIETERSAVVMTGDSQRERVRRHDEAALAQAQEQAMREQQNIVQQALETLRTTYSRSQRAAKLGVDYANTFAQRQSAQAALPDLQLEGDGPLIVSLDARLQFLQAEIRRIEQALTERRQEMNRLETSGVCYVCLRPMDGPDHQHVMAAQATQISELETRLSELESQSVILEQARPAALAFERAELQLSELIGQQRKLDEEGPIRQDLETLNAEGQRLRQQASELGEQLGTIIALTRDLDPSAHERLAQTEAQLAQLTAQRDALMIEIGDGFDAAEKADRETRLHAAEQLVAEARGRLPELRVAAERAATDASARQREYAALADKLAGIQQLRQQVLRLENIQTYLRGFQHKLAREIRPALEEIGSEMLQQISGGRHTAMRIDDNYEIEVETASGSWLRASSLSGGEDVRANLCLRLALTRLVSQRTGVPVRFLVFDEPLPAQDPGHIERIMELLDSLRPFYSQIYIISHVGDLENSDYVDYVMQFTAASGHDRVRLVRA
jgi:exonuclease SbcC